MKCAVHPEVDATGFCRNCGKAMCPACVRPVRDLLYCEDCLGLMMGLPPAQSAGPGATPVAPAMVASTPMPVATNRVPNPAVAFILGFAVPGLGAIYNEEYNKAMIHVLIFGGIIVGDYRGTGRQPAAVLDRGPGGICFLHGYRCAAYGKSEANRAAGLGPI